MMTRFLGKWILCTILLAGALNAVVISTGDGQGNTTAPVDDFGFANVGRRDVASAIYLGNYGGEYWVMTAHHVGAGNVVLGGITYTMVADSAVRIKNPVEYGLTHSNTDITLFRISADPGLPNLLISDTPMSTSSAISVAGRGWQRSEELAWWDASWNETTEPPFPDFSPLRRGYKRATPSTSVVRWGTDVISLADSVVDYNSTSQYTFRTTFDWNTVGMQAVYGDSGGGAFYKDGDTWVLAGLTVLQGTLTGQPANTAVYGNQTVFIDLAYYRDQIYAVIPIPEHGTITLIGGLFGLAGCLVLRRYRQRHSVTDHG